MPLPVEPTVLVSTGTVAVGGGAVCGADELEVPDVPPVVVEAEPVFVEAEPVLVFCASIPYELFMIGTRMECGIVLTSGAEWDLPGCEVDFGCLRGTILRTFGAGATRKTGNVKVATESGSSDRARSGSREEKRARKRRAIDVQEARGCDPDQSPSKTTAPEGDQPEPGVTNVRPMSHAHPEPSSPSTCSPASTPPETGRCLPQSLGTRLMH